MLHVSSCHSKWVTSRIDFAHLAGTGLGGYSCASKCQIVVVHGSSRSSSLIPMGSVYRWSVRVLLNSNVCFWTRIRKWRRSQSHCDSFCAPWVSKWEPIQLEILGFLSGPRHLATPHRTHEAVPWSIRHACAGVRPAAVSRCEQSASLILLWRWCGCRQASWAPLFVDLLFIKIKLSARKHNLFVPWYSSRSAGTLLCSLACLCLSFKMEFRASSSHSAHLKAPYFGNIVDSIPSNKSFLNDVSCLRFLPLILPVSLLFPPALYIHFWKYIKATNIFEHF